MTLPTPRRRAAGTSLRVAAPDARVIVSGHRGADRRGHQALARLLHTRYASDLLLEHFADNPFLPLFYQEPERYALPTQLHFLLDRFDQLSEATRTQPLLIATICSPRTASLPS